MRVQPSLDFDKADDALFILQVTGNTIIASEVALTGPDKDELYKALSGVVHEAMHLYEIEKMHAVLQSTSASKEEREYALRIAFASMGGSNKDDTAQYISYLPESSASYFEDRYMEGMAMYRERQQKKLRRW